MGRICTAALCVDSGHLKWWRERCKNRFLWHEKIWDKRYAILYKWPHGFPAGKAWSGSLSADGIPSHGGWWLGAGLQNRQIIWDQSLPVSFVLSAGSGLYCRGQGGHLSRSRAAVLGRVGVWFHGRNAAERRLCHASNLWESSILCHVFPWKRNLERTRPG